VNAYLAEREGTELSLEYLFLGLLNSSYEPAPWEPINTLTWAKAMAWDLRDNMDSEIQRAIFLASMPEVRVNELFPDYNPERPIIVPDFSLPDFITNNETVSNYFAATGDSFNGLEQIVSKVDDLLGGDPAAELGSNSWVVSGDLSATGAPLMANDPHLSTGIPSLWYQVGLHCAPVGPDCSYETVGVSFVGAPGVVIGHNNRIAWGLTNVGADVMDLYVVVTNPNDPYQYEMNGQWIDMGIEIEEIVVAGGQTIEFPVRITQFGPIISDVYADLDNFGGRTGLGISSGNYAIALRWTALEPGRTFQSIFNINRAQDFDEFRIAAAQFVVPSQNLLYADVDGNIGYQMPGFIPVRANGDGRYPAPGWTDEFSWIGYIPFEQLPYALNPDSGYIVAANNAIVTEDYPYLIADTWDYGYRAQRIVDMLTAANGPVDIEYYKQMQADSVNLGALAVIPQLAGIEFEDAEVAELRDQLLAWDGDQTVDSSMAALFNTYWQQLMAETFHDELPEEYWPGGNSSWYDVILNLSEELDNKFWDDVTTSQVETRDEILASSFSAAVTELKAINADPAKWTWGDLHHKTFIHQTMDSFPIIGGLFNRGPFATSGGSAIVNATNWDAASGSFAVTSLPSKRTIYDMSNWQNSLQMHTTGQSGHAYHEHYIDLAEMWAAVQYNPMHWDRAVIEEVAEAHLVLTPTE
jgi:penicillin amidase